MNHEDLLVRYLYIPLAALAGAVSSLGARRWRTMTKAKMAMTVLMGATFAIFVTPWAAHQFIGVDESDARGTVALTYLFAIGAHVLLPWLIQRLERLIGAGDAQ
ncbi:hypothetical protein [Sphingobium cupriresistens]|uniref:Uncharacterized protein n=1 Tax=Sphingobium cupriresistens LL01 TaxID=1420583 RepID=A0A0J8AJ22_9SPHN|nr:hypothetical protein [Sphingobium cupriresistens]KMS54730.1 hypothetical protein V473_15450 [Sphingobium cupriresistens LL01]